MFKDVKTLDDIVKKINEGNKIEDIFKENLFAKVIKERDNVNNKIDNEENEIENNNEQ